MTAKWDEYMRLEGWRDYYVIEAYQYIAIESERKKVIKEIEAYQYIAYESERKKVIREIEACRTAEEAKAVIDKVRAA